MYTHRCVLIEISMEIGMLNFGLGLLVTALMKETYFRTEVHFIFLGHIERESYDQSANVQISPPSSK